MKKEFERVSPEAQGIESLDVLRLIDDLESSGSEMHGIIIMRRGKVISEGWWKPYEPGIIHGSQSLTKTFTGTAFGIAMKEGLLSLDERLIDIFPEYVPQNPSPYLKDLRMRHILTMSAGMEKMPAVYDPDWKRKFFEMPIIHPPGSAFFYNSAACSMVGACIQKKTGLILKEYLRTRLFDKIGIDTDKIRWFTHADGLENGSGGIVTSTEDNARLMLLYQNGGVWESERILPDEWVNFATNTQNSHMHESDPGTPETIGYGGMMWLYKGAYYADGAMGQLSIVFPEKEMLISVNQTCADSESYRRMKESLFNFPACAKKSPLPESEQALLKLSKRLKALSLPAPQYAPYSDIIGQINGKKCEIADGRAVFFPEDIGIYNKSYHDDVYGFGFKFSRGILELEVTSESGTHNLLAGLDGAARQNRIKSYIIPAEDVLLSAHFGEGDVLCLDIRWTEVCRTRKIFFTFNGNGAKIVSTVKQVGGFDMPPQEAYAKWL